MCLSIPDIFHQWCEAWRISKDRQTELKRIIKVKEQREKQCLDVVSKWNERVFLRMCNVSVLYGRSKFGILVGPVAQKVKNVTNRYLVPFEQSSINDVSLKGSKKTDKQFWSESVKIRNNWKKDALIWWTKKIGHEFLRMCNCLCISWPSQFKNCVGQGSHNIFQLTVEAVMISCKFIQKKESIDVKISNLHR